MNDLLDYMRSPIWQSWGFIAAMTAAVITFTLFVSERLLANQRALQNEAKERQRVPSRNRALEDQINTLESAVASLQKTVETLSSVEALAGIKVMDEYGLKRTIQRIVGDKTIQQVRVLLSPGSLLWAEEIELLSNLIANRVSTEVLVLDPDTIPRLVECQS